MFGISGRLIFVLSCAALWYWAKKRRTLEGPARTAAGFRLVSYVFFLFVVLLACTLLGNPIFGLYFPEKVRRLNSLPTCHTVGTEAVIYSTLGWLLTFLSHYEAAQAKG